MAEPPTIVERTQQALDTLQQHQDYCRKLEKDYLHKHDEVKMYVDLITNINKKIEVYIITAFAEDEELSNSFIQMINELKLGDEINNTDLKKKKESKKNI